MARHYAGFDLVASDHARFKRLCATRGTTMPSEVQAILGAQLSAAPDGLLFLR
jgi:hypothetical protein